MLFKRLLTIWFLLFTLASNTAWADSDHDDGGYGGDLYTESVSDHPSSIWSDDACADHCDHASVHALGLISSIAIFSPAARPPVTLVPISKLLSREFSPLHHPPITT
ncbi:hypothetical protein MNBD_GAMMA13-1187 [hydrothermal vent metagenome]|uniref:Uncharacterized protein n=1 Tax=hydrothermal vent metagenome TaxID=652676 RepID=A0A3B0YA42_9ZZZZ